MRHEPKGPTAPATINLSSRSCSTSNSARPSAVAGALEREDLLDRLMRLRTVLPALGEELAGARRQAAVLRRENRRLLTEVRRLQHQNTMSIRSRTLNGDGRSEEVPS